MSSIVTAGSVRPRRALAALAAIVGTLGLALGILASADVRATGNEASSPEPGLYGRTLLLDVRMSPDQLARYASHKASKPSPGESALVNAMIADTVEWIGSPIDTRVKDSPYTMVVTLTGTAREDGDVGTLWQSGWKFDDGTTRSTPFPGLSRNGVKAGERIEVTKPSSPISFKEDRSLAPVLSFVRSSNVDIDSVRLQVWSGMARTTPLQFLMAYRYALVGVVMLGLAMIWLRR